MVTSDRTATLVEFCPAQPYASLAAARGYRNEGNCADGGSPLVKPVAARSGDTVEFSDAGIAVNARVLANSKPLSVDTHSRPLQHWPFGTYSVQPGSVWLMHAGRVPLASRYADALVGSGLLRDRKSFRKIMGFRNLCALQAMLDRSQLATRYAVAHHHEPPTNLQLRS